MGKAIQLDRDSIYFLPSSDDLKWLKFIVS
jgi:hypothetical protein